jgi:hypothetical protein
MGSPAGNGESLQRNFERGYECRAIIGAVERL